MPIDVFGTANNDTLIGTAAAEYYFSLTGDDSVSAGGGNDSIEAG